MKIKKISLAALSVLAMASFGSMVTNARNLVILTTNDVHSTVDPGDDGNGGVLQRKAIIDSVRRAEKDVMLIDAGDAVQGSLYFRFFRGLVENELMQLQDYDLRILGNHEFDNGINELAHYLTPWKGKVLSANYDARGTALDGLLTPYVVKKIDGKRIGFFGLNVDPKGLIGTDNMGGVRFKDVITTANTAAAMLRKKEKCDLVVAVTHIGYTAKDNKTTDVDLARASKDIDIIIGGHSHTVVTPGREGKYPSIVNNAEGRPVLIAQTGKYGPNIGYINIDLDDLKKGKRPSAEEFEYRLIPVTDRFPHESYDQDITAWLAPYKHDVDSVNARVIGYAPTPLDSDDPVGEYANWTADMARDIMQQTLDSIHAADPASTLPVTVDMAIMNVGGIRQDMKAGPVTEGKILSTFPFTNKLVLLDLTGEQLLQAMESAARRGGEAISAEMKVLVDDNNHMIDAWLNGRAIDPEKHYYVVTINYLADGNDGFQVLTGAPRLWTDERDVAAPILRYVTEKGKAGLPMQGYPYPRFIKKIPVTPAQ